MMHDSLLLLRNLTGAGSSIRVLSWGHSTSPEMVIDAPASVALLEGSPDGFLELHPVLAHYRLHDYRPDIAVRATPNTAVDAAVNVDPAPREPDDTFSRRTAQLVSVVGEVIRSFEHSMGLRLDKPAPPRPSADPRLEAGPPPTPWTPQEHAALALTAEELDQLRKSPCGLATVLGADEMTPPSCDAGGSFRAPNPASPAAAR